ncbi:MAG TPA: hypothetical protein VFV38_39725 [Ktedonobacteraceae bacterium]|nr:hypothetical protein [Ktedonobacteraceae bacterium]
MCKHFLSAVQVAQILGEFGTGDVQTTHGPLWFLTNGLAENTGHWHTDVFDYFGVGYQATVNEESYPLTPQEEQFIQPDGITLAEYATNLRLGYTVWWQDRKWFCPLLEYCYEPEDPILQYHGRGRERGDFLSRPYCLRAFVESEAERLTALLRPLHGEVLLDLEGFTDRYVIYLLSPVADVLARFPDNGAWHSFLRSLFPVTETPLLIYLDTNCEHEHDGVPNLSNASGKSYGCSLYDLPLVPSVLSEDGDEVEAFGDWLRTQEPCLKVWAPSEAAAIYNARLACDARNLIPVNPFTRRYLPRTVHLLV